MSFIRFSLFKLYGIKFSRALFSCGENCEENSSRPADEKGGRGADQPHQRRSQRACWPPASDRGQPGEQRLLRVPGSTGNNKQ
jgi:hypothetical protein